MKKRQPTGIWIDLKEAIIATGDEIIDTVESEFTFGHAKGGSGSSTPYGPQDAISESKVLEKRKQAIQQYFREIIQRLDHVTDLLIIGPGDTKNQLARAIGESYQLKNVNVYIETIDKITHNQIRAKIRDIFEIE